MIDINIVRDGNTAIFKVGTYQGGTWLLNGNIAYPGQEYQAELPFTLLRVASVRVLQKAVGTVEGMADIQAKDYLDRLERLESAKTDGKWNSLEDEYAFKKFKEVYQPVYRTQDHIEDEVTFTVDSVPHVVKSSDYISGLHTIGEDKFKLWGTYLRLDCMRHAIEDMLLKYDLQAWGGYASQTPVGRYHLHASSSRHGDLRLNLEGSEVISKRIEPSVEGPIKELEEMRESDRLFVQEIFKKHFANKRGVPSIGDVIAVLKEALRRLQNIDSMKRTRQTQHSLIRYLEDKVGEFQKLALQMQEEENGGVVPGADVARD